MKGAIDLKRKPFKLRVRGWTPTGHVGRNGREMEKKHVCGFVDNPKISRIIVAPHLQCSTSKSTRGEYRIITKRGR